MTEFGVPLPPTTPKPDPITPGMVIHSVYDLAADNQTEAYRRYLRAQTDEERMAALADMPNATVAFYELREGESMFDEVPVYQGDFKDFPATDD